MPASTKTKPKLFGQYRDSMDVLVRAGNTAHFTRELQTFTYRPGRKGVYRLAVEGATYGAMLRVYATNSANYDGPGDKWTQLEYRWLRDVTEGELELVVPRHLFDNPNTPPISHIRGYVGFADPVDESALRWASENGHTYYPPAYEPFRATIAIEYSEVDA